jgi:hypothetical protein
MNIAEILRECPKGMKLYSPIFGDVYLDKIRPHLAIVVTTDKQQGDFKEEFLYDGRYGMNGECMLFPSKDKTTWEGFVPPCEFKDGDILFVKSVYPFIVIYKENENENEECFYKYVAIKDYPDCTHIFDGIGPLCHKKGVSKIRFATKEEKQKLFQVIEAKGYKWNPETKTLDKLVKSKFEISTLVPFDKVLVWDVNTEKWDINFFSRFDDDLGLFKTMTGYYSMCIPYKGNEDLVDTGKDCDEYYKTWE